MSLQTLLNRIDELQATIEAAGKFNPEVLKKINYKFRLDWNYHSNAMEGNSLTKEETRSVMVGISVEGKSFKDMLEMKGHDQVISDILKIGKGELGISEKRIKDIHKAIIHEDDPEQKKKLGEWKTSNNRLTNYKGEDFDFLNFSEVPDAMHQLINWLSSQTEQLKVGKNKLHPALIAFEFHLKYLTIHPFYDGNGRTARILTNLILISFGYPPLIIKKEEKKVYYRYLADIQGYGGSPDLYYEFMCKLVIHSQELVLKAIEGEDIDDPDDLDKKLLLLEKKLEAVDPDNTVIDHFNVDVFFRMYNGWIIDLLTDTIPLVQKFNTFFTGTNHYISFFNAAVSVSFTDDNPADIIQRLTQQLINNQIKIDYHSENGLKLSTHYGTFKKGGLQTFGCNYSFTIKFDYTKYYVVVDEFYDEVSPKKSHEFAPHLLHKPFTKKEQKLVSKKFGEAIYEHIEYYATKFGII